MKISLHKNSFGLFDDTLSYAKMMEEIEKVKMENELNKNNDKLNLKEIIQVDFPSDQYYRQQTKKKQIVLHHTVSGQGVEGDIRWWKQTKSRIATPIIIDYKGNIFQCFSTKYWGHHLGVKQKVFDGNGITKTNNVILNKQSIGVEIDSWGGLVKSKKYWYPAKWDAEKNKFVGDRNQKPVKNVQTYEKGYKGFYAFEKYTDEQIESLRKLIVYWNDVYNIPLNYNDDMWDVSLNALNGESGIWSHVSYRDDKSDCHPQPELIEMLKSLK
ncbi:MAG: N-acetylmuramoyl-L-alanine amidase [bacterium]